MCEPSTNGDDLFTTPVSFIAPVSRNYPPSDVAFKAIAHENGGQCVQISPLGNTIVSGGGDGYVKMWD